MSWGVHIARTEEIINC